VKSVQSVFERFAWTELWHLGGFDFNLSASAGVATRAGRAFSYGKCAKSDQGHRAPFFEGDSNGTEGGFESAASGCLGQVSLLGYVFDQFCFVHKKPLGERAPRIRSIEKTQEREF
jgi:hypothetical protein